MARITVEDCLHAIDNRFELVLAASKRAHQLAKGISEPMVEINNDKPTVLALREIAEGWVTKDILEQPDYHFVANSLDLAFRKTSDD